MDKKHIKGIMATTLEGVVGLNNTLPWHYKDELEHFRRTTLGHIIIMGSKTYQSTPKNILIERNLIVFSKEANLQIIHGRVVNSLEEFLKLIQEIDSSEIMFMIGGAEIAHLFLEAKLLSSFILTKIHYPYIGDTYLNMNYFNDWSENIISSNGNYTIFELTPPKIQ